MNDRGMKKWRPFNAVVPAKVLLEKDESIPLPELSEDEIGYYEDILISSLYTHSPIKIYFIENGKKKEVKDYVKSFDSISKNVILQSRKINFRQIYKIDK